MTWVKICGTTNLEDARLAVDAGADALGFIFAPSPRRIELDAAREIIAALPPQIEKVGVFVNECAERIHQIVEQAGLTAVQLHGDETADFARELLESPNSAPGRRVFKAIAVRGGFGAKLIAFADQGKVDAVLLDSSSLVARGGTGQTFDWRAVAQYLPQGSEDIRIIVAGGLDPSNVDRVLRLLRPYGVDVVSGVEREPGKKDPEKVRAFIAAVRQAEKTS